MYPEVPQPLPETPHAHAGASVVGLRPLVATDLQDHLLTATNDLERLQRLLDDAGDTLIGHFHGAARHLETALRLMSEQPDIDQGHLHQAMESVGEAITAMQFQDMASQLLHHTRKRLRGCADRVAQSVLADDEDGQAVIEDLPLKPNPVTQDEMDAGSVELF